ncbi:MAG: hypothetical protein AAB421_03670 [Patescibacteria group bacterium]
MSLPVLLNKSKKIIFLLMGTGLLVVMVSAMLPTTTSAVGMCPCCEIPKKCPQKCPPCFDLKCKGICLPGPGGPQQCKGIGCSQGDGTMDMAGGMPPMLPMIMPPMKMPSMMMMPMDMNPNNASSSDRFAPASPLGDFFDTSSDRNDDANQPATNPVADIASDIISFFGVATPAADPQPAGVPGDRASSTGNPSSFDLDGDVVETASGITVRTRGTDATTNTGVAGFFGRFFTGGERVQQAQNQNNAFFGRICIARPWQASFVARIFSTSFFDSLCERRGYTTRTAAIPTQATPPATKQVGVAELTCTERVSIGDSATISWKCPQGSQSSATGFDTKGRAAGSVTLQPTDTTTYALRCANGARASCTVVVGKPSVQVVAHPARVQLGARAKIYWTSEGVVECTITGPNLKERGPRGAATTAAILDAAKFTATCDAGGGKTVTDSVIVDVGI